MGDEDETAGAGRRGGHEVVEPGRWDAEEARDRVGDLRGVEGADEREEAPGGVREPGDGAGRVGRGRVGDAEGRPARAQAEDEVPDAEPEPQRSCHVVAGARPDDGTDCPPLPRWSVGAKDLGEPRLPVDRVIDEAEEIGAVALLGR